MNKSCYNIVIYIYDYSLKLYYTDYYYNKYYIARKKNSLNAENVLCIDGARLVLLTDYVNVNHACKH